MRSHRALSLLLAVGSASGCAQSVECGSGTQRKQLDNGDIACVAVAAARGETSCDADGGVHLVAGNQCVSSLQCGPGTVLDTQSSQCVPAQMMPHQPAACPTPAADKVCVNGTVRNFIDGSYLSGQTVHVAVYDPTRFLGGGMPAPSGEATTSDTFVIPNLPAPSETTPYVLVVVDDSAGQTQYARVAIGGVVHGGQSVRVDGYVLTRAQLQAWSTAASLDLATRGALVYRLFNDPPPPVTARTPTETHPVMGAQMIDLATKQPPDTVKYFGASLATIDPLLTATSATGGALVLPGMALAGYTARGGGVTTWEQHTAQLISGIVQIDFIHPQP